MQIRNKDRLVAEAAVPPEHALESSAMNDIASLATASLSVASITWKCRPTPARSNGV